MYIEGKNALKESIMSETSLVTHVARIQRAASFRKTNPRLIKSRCEYCQFSGFVPENQIGKKHPACPGQVRRFDNGRIIQTPAGRLLKA